MSRKQRHLLDLISANDLTQVDMLWRDHGRSLDKPVHIQANDTCAKWPPLCFAVKFGQSSIVQYLISKGCSTKCQGWMSKKGVREYFNPLSLACKGKKIDILKMLVDAGVDVNSQLPGDQMEEEEGGSIDFKDVRNTCLHWAVQYGQVEVVRTLLQNGASPNIQNGFMETPLHVACDYYNPLIIKDLILYGAVSNNANHAGMTPLGILISYESGSNLVEYKNSIRLLVRAGYDMQHDLCWQKMLSEDCSSCHLLKTFPDQHFICRLKHIMLNPKKLSHICRLQIRTMFHYDAAAFQALPISKAMKEFLSLPNSCLELSDVVATAEAVPKEMKSN